MARPEKEINWEIVEKRIEAGCNGVEIAAALRIDSDTFYIRFKKKYGKSFQDCSAHFYSAGDANLKFTQYMKALAGNTHVLTLLGRERLNQGKEEEIKKSPYEDIVNLRHENMLLQAEIQRLKEEGNADKSETE